MDIQSLLREGNSTEAEFEHASIFLFSENNSQKNSLKQKFLKSVDFHSVKRPNLKIAKFYETIFFSKTTLDKENNINNYKATFALYDLSVDINGYDVSILKEQMEHSVNILCFMIESCTCDILVKVENVLNILKEGEFNFNRTYIFVKDCVDLTGDGKFNEYFFLFKNNFKSKIINLLIN
jgi:hypothetical protein